MFVFQKTWHALFSWNTRSEICPFCLITNEVVEQGKIKTGVSRSKIEEINLKNANTK